MPDLYYVRIHCTCHHHLILGPIDDEEPSDTNVGYIDKKLSAQDGQTKGNQRLDCSVGIGFGEL